MKLEALWMVYDHPDAFIGEPESFLPFHQKMAKLHHYVIGAVILSKAPDNKGALGVRDFEAMNHAWYVDLDEAIADARERYAKRVDQDLADTVGLDDREECLRDFDRGAEELRQEHANGDCPC